MASADHINYAIRPNKTVERKLVFETLAFLDPVYNFAEYQYIGLGSVWFVDFVLAHRYLSISDMISIEKDERLAARAKFNKPYACVNIELGESSLVLPFLSLEERQILVWFDYDTSLDGPVLEDLSILCSRAKSGSLVIVTINANKDRLPGKNGNGSEFSSDEERLRHFVGDFAPDLIPQFLPKKAMQASQYPSTLASLIFQHMSRQVRKAGREDDRVLPLFNIAYKDSTQMLPVGAAIENKQYSNRTTEELIKLEAQKAIRRMSEDSQITIKVPPLTLKEKATLDQLMPCDTTPTEDMVSQLGFRLKPSQIEAYHNFYRYYPMFGEITI